MAWARRRVERSMTLANNDVVKLRDGSYSVAFGVLAEGVAFLNYARIEMKMERQSKNYYLYCFHCRTKDCTHVMDVIAYRRQAFIEPFEESKPDPPDLPNNDTQDDGN